MNGLKQTVAVSFGKIAGWAYRHCFLALALVIGINLILISQLPKLTVDMSNESFFRPTDPVLVGYNQFRDQFGKDEFVVIGIDHPDIFSFSFLSLLKKLHETLETNVPYLDEITSLANVRNTRGEGDDLIVEDFLEQWPQTDEELQSLRRRAEENTLYTNYILSEDQQTTAVIIKPLACNPESVALLKTEGSCQPMTTPQNREMMAAIEEVLDEFNSSTFSTSLSGMPAVIDVLNTSLEKDFSKIIPATLLVLILFLGLMFRRLSGVIYPMLLNIFSLLSTLGLMAVMKIPMTNITTILPSFILVVSISDAVHILAIFYREFQRTGDKEQAIIEAMEHSGLAILMTTITTAGGLASFMAAKIAPIADLGIVTPIGVFLALLYTSLLLPALLSLFPVKHKAHQHRRQKGLDELFRTIAHFACTRQYQVISIFLILLMISVAGMTKLRFAHSALKWFPESSSIRQNTEYLDQKMRGTVSLDVVIDTGRPDGLYDPALIKSLEKISTRYSQYADEDIFVGKLLDLTTILKETNRALHNNDPEKYIIPENRHLIAQELFLFQLSGSDDLEELVDQQFSKTRMTMHLPYEDSSKFKHFIGTLKADLKRHLPESEITITGVNALFIEMLNNVMVTMSRSYFIALCLISFLMIGMLGRLRLGLLSMVPNVFPIVVVMGLMGWLGIPLDFGTILIGSIAIGIIVDDTIHFLHNYGRYYDQTSVPRAATFMTLQTAGRAMLTTSVVLIAGFLCNMLSSLTLTVHVGILIGATIFIALLTDFFLAPALLSLVYKPKKITVMETAS